MKEFKESGLVFRFSDRWDVYQLDQEADYREKINRQIPGTRSVDFVGFNEVSRVLLLVEVKGFRGYGDRRNWQRLTGEKDDLTIEIAQKVRDSLATMIGGARCSTNLREVWRKNIAHLLREGNLKVVAWVELDVSTVVRLGRAKINMGIKQAELRKRLTWLTSDVQILNTCNYQGEIEGMQVCRV